MGLMGFATSCGPERRRGPVGHNPEIEPQIIHGASNRETTIARGLPAWAGAHSPVSLVPKPGTGIRLLCRSCLMSSAPGPRKRGLFF